jgi:hypothetical protein
MRSEHQLCVSEKHTASIPKSGALFTAGRQLKSFVRNILQISLLFPIFCAGIAPSPSTNSNENNILTGSCKKKCG